MPVTDTLISYQSAQQEDIPVIFAFAKELIDTYEDVSSIDYEKVLCWVCNKIEKNITHYQCIFYDGVKVGYIHIIPGKEETELDDLYIYPEFRGQGIGTAVLTQCIDTIKTPLFLYVFRKNIGAINLYSRIGFSISEEVGKTRYIMRLRG